MTKEQTFAIQLISELVPELEILAEELSDLARAQAKLHELFFRPGPSRLDTLSIRASSHTRELKSALAIFKLNTEKGE